MMLLAYAGAAGTMSSHGHGKSLKRIAIYFITRKEYAIRWSPHQIETYSLG